MSRPLYDIGALALVFALACVGTPGAALAGVEQAREHSDRAQKLYGQGEYEEAAELLQKAYRDEPNLTYQYNRIRALQGAEEYEKALSVLRTYESAMLEAKGYDDLPAIESTLESQVEKDRRGESATSTGDRQWREDTPRESSSETESSENESSENESSGNEEEPRDRAAAPPADGPPAADTGTDAESGANRTLGWTLLAAGGATLTAGALFASGVFLPGETEGGSYTGSTKTLKTHKIAAGTLIGLGVASSAAGVYFALVAPGNSGRAGASESAAVALHPRLLPDGAGAGLSIQFR